MGEGRGQRVERLGGGCGKGRRGQFETVLEDVRPGTIIHTDIDDPSVPPAFPAPVRDDDPQMGGHVEVPGVLAKQGGPGRVPESGEARSDLAGMGRRDCGRHVAIESHVGVAGLRRGGGLCEGLGGDELEIGGGEPA